MLKKLLNKWTFSLLATLMLFCGLSYVHYKMSFFVPVSPKGLDIIPSEKRTPDQWRNFSENKKIWVHAAYRDFDPDVLSENNGLEFDIYVDAQQDEIKLYVNHDFPEGKVLSEWLDMLKGNKADYYYWFDMKNLSLHNNKSVLIALKQVLDKYGIPYGNAIVESPCPELLSLFTREGFLTSYYLPYLPRDKHKLNSVLREVVSKAEKSDISAISSNIAEADIYGALFPGMIRLHWGVSAYVEPTKPYEMWLARKIYRSKLRELLEEPKVRVFLVSPARPVKETEKILLEK